MRGKRTVKIVAGALLAIAVVVLVGFTAFELDRYFADRWHRVEPSGTPSNRAQDALEDETLTVNGVRYRHRRGVESYLLMGVDQTGEELASASVGGQADLLLLLVVDSAQDTYHVLEINRDTMATSFVLAEDGSILREDYRPICLSHSAGSGGEDSCLNTVRTVEYLLSGEEIDGYIAIDLDAIGVMNDAVGGVTVRIEDDLTGADAALRKGETVTLDARLAERFVRARMSVGDENNLARMRRQRQYLSAWLSKMRKRSTQDASFLADLLQEIGELSVTNLTEKRMTSIMNDMYKYADGGTLSIEGEYVVGEVYHEFYADSDSLQQAILTLFYEAE